MTCRKAWKRGGNTVAATEVILTFLAVLSLEGFPLGFFLFAVGSTVTAKPVVDRAVKGPTAVSIPAEAL